MAFIPSTGINYDAGFPIKSIDFSFDNALSTFDKTVSASVYGLDLNTPLVIGSLYEPNINLTWEIERPVSKEIYK